MIKELQKLATIADILVDNPYLDAEQQRFDQFPKSALPVIKLTLWKMLGGFRRVCVL